MAACCTCPVCGSHLPDDAFIVDLYENVAIRNGLAVRMSPLETAILYLLWQSRPAVVDYEKVISGAWGANQPADVRACLTVIMSRLRRKIAPLGIQIRVAYGRGLYLFAGEADKAREVA